jgi:hypothetical protein
VWLGNAAAGSAGTAGVVGAVRQRDGSACAVRGVPPRVVAVSDGTAVDAAAYDGEWSAVAQGSEIRIGRGDTAFALRRANKNDARPASRPSKGPSTDAHGAGDSPHRATVVKLDRVLGPEMGTVVSLKFARLRAKCQQHDPTAAADARNEHEQDDGDAADADAMSSAASTPRGTSKSVTTPRGGTATSSSKKKAAATAAKGGATSGSRAASPRAAGGSQAGKKRLGASSGRGGPKRGGAGASSAASAGADREAALRRKAEDAAAAAAAAAGIVPMTQIPVLAVFATGGCALLAASDGRPIFTRVYDRHEVRGSGGGGGGGGSGGGAPPCGGGDISADGQTMVFHSGDGRVRVLLVSQAAQVRRGRGVVEIRAEATVVAVLSVPEAASPPGAAGFLCGAPQIAAGTDTIGGRGAIIAPLVAPDGCVSCAVWTATAAAAAASTAAAPPGGKRAAVARAEQTWNAPVPAVACIPVAQCAGRTEIAACGVSTTGGAWVVLTTDNETAAAAAGAHRRCVAIIGLRAGAASAAWRIDAAAIGGSIDSAAVTQCGTQVVLVRKGRVAVANLVTDNQ